MRDLGSIQSPQNAFLLNLGLETLHLRVPGTVKTRKRWRNSCKGRRMWPGSTIRARCV